MRLHRLDVVDAATRAPTHLARESRSFRDGAVPTQDDDARADGCADAEPHVSADARADAAADARAHHSGAVRRAYIGADERVPHVRRANQPR